MAGILAAIRKNGNGLNYNPHVHMIATRELLNMKTGEIISAAFISYKKIRFHWQDVVLLYHVRKKIIITAESIQFRRQYQNGFHVYFQSITGTENDVLFRTAESPASGHFHNSQKKRFRQFQDMR